MSIDGDVSIEARARRLKESRELVYPSAEAAAAALGLNGVTVRAHESAQNGFPVETAVLYAKAYGVSLDWLLTGRTEEAKRTPPPPPEGAAVILMQMPNGKARIQVNKIVPMAVAIQVLQLVEGAEQ